jgi:uncharacterized protein (TIGR02757 family)
VNKGIKLKEFLNKKVDEFNQLSFIKNDPISIPHLFTKKQDIEIAGFFAAIFAWGNRTTIIRKSKDLMERMDNSPYQFVLQHAEKDLLKLTGFKQRTFNETDLLYFIEFLKHHYSLHNSLEDAFLKFPPQTSSQAGRESFMESALNGFYNYFFSLEYIPSRTRKHIATPGKGSTCKRLNMYLRWMVRNDNTGVDFGIWKKIPSSELICPIDLHVARVAKKLNLLHRNQIDWQAALELTSYLRKLDKADPVKYDFALFGLGAIEPGFFKKLRKKWIIRY